MQIGGRSRLGSHLRSLPKNTFQQFLAALAALSIVLHSCNVFIEVFISMMQLTAILWFPLLLFSSFLFSLSLELVWTGGGSRSLWSWGGVLGVWNGFLQSLSKWGCTQKFELNFIKCESGSSCFVPLCLDQSRKSWFVLEPRCAPQSLPLPLPHLPSQKMRGKSIRKLYINRDQFWKEKVKSCSKPTTQLPHLPLSVKKGRK